jgi:hypothetical protein
MYQLANDKNRWYNKQRLNLRVGSHCGLFPLTFPPVAYTHSFSSTFMLHAPPILVDLIILITLDEEHKLCSSSLCSFLHPPVTPSLFCQNTLLSTML